VVLAEPQVGEAVPKVGIPRFVRLEQALRAALGVDRYRRHGLNRPRSGAKGSPRVYVAANLLVFGLALSSCSGDTQNSGPDRISPTRNAASAQVETTLKCADPVGATASPAAPLKALANAAAVDAGSFLKTSKAGVEALPATLFAESNVLIHAQHPSRIVVRAPEGVSATARWGNAEIRSLPSSEIVVPSCPVKDMRSGDWLAFSGGFYVSAPACLIVEVTTSASTASTQVSVGKACS
jgi:hypothetical protein